ncbi:hypothetical protein ACFLV7_08510 [Chloroflexota bacterium]
MCNQRCTFIWTSSGYLIGRVMIIRTSIYAQYMGQATVAFTGQSLDDIEQAVLTSKNVTRAEIPSDCQPRSSYDQGETTGYYSSGTPLIGYTSPFEKPYLSYT